MLFIGAKLLKVWPVTNMELFVPFFYMPCFLIPLITGIIGLQHTYRLGGKIVGLVHGLLTLGLVGIVGYWMTLFFTHWTWWLTPMLIPAVMGLLAIWFGFTRKRP